MTPNADSVRQSRLTQQYGDRLVRMVRKATRAAYQAGDDQAPFAFLEALRAEGYDVVPLQIDSSGATDA